MSAAPPAQPDAASGSRARQQAWRVTGVVAAVGALAAGWAAWSALRRRRARATGAALYDMPAYTQLSLSDAQAIFDAFRPSVCGGSSRFTVVRIRELMGGLSNSNYHFVVRDNDNGATETNLLLKVCEEKNVHEVAYQLRALAQIRRLTLDPSLRAHPEFPHPCPIAYAYRSGLAAEDETTLEQSLAQVDGDGEDGSGSGSGDYIFFVPSVSSRPLVFYEYLDGAMLSAGTPAILHEVARAQAQLHSVPLSHGSCDFSFLPSTPFGMFAVRDQYEAQIVHAPPNTATPLIAQHPFVAFLQSQLGALDECAAASESLPTSVIHSDLFYQNMIFARPACSDDPPRLLGMIDFEEMGRGPRILDVAMTVVGCCYSLKSNRLEPELLRAFLRSYQSFTPLTAAERRLFKSFLVWALMAIAYWRFQNFNIVHPEANERKDAYQLMQQRIEELQQPHVQKLFDTLFD